MKRVKKSVLLRYALFQIPDLLVFILILLVESEKQNDQGFEDPIR